MPPKRDSALTIPQIKAKLKELGYAIPADCKLKADYVNALQDAENGKGKKSEDESNSGSDEEDVTSKRKAAPAKKETAAKKSKTEDEEKPRRSGRAASKKKEESSGDESEEEEEKPKRKAPAKKSAAASKKSKKEESEDEKEDEPAEEKPAKKVPAKKSAKEEKQEDERDEVNGDIPAEPEEEKPAKKAPAKKGGKKEEEEPTEEGEEGGDEDDDQHASLKSCLYEEVLKHAPDKTRNTGDFGMTWYEYRSLYICDSEEIKGSEKILAFDMDGTLVDPKSGKKFAAGRNDWEWILSEGTVVERLKKEHDNGVKIVIFTNQAGIKKGKTRRSDIEGKIIDLAKELGFPLQAFVASTEDVFRKPNCTAWDYMIRHHNQGVKPDLSQCKYIGDAGGRVKLGSRKKDFSCGDRAFGHNIGIDFMTPEEFFNGDKKRTDFEWDGVDPVALVEKYDGKPDPAELNIEYPDGQELVILVGTPASGKSTFAKRYFLSKGYVWGNNDICNGNNKKVMKQAKEAIDSGKNVIIDNTNGTAAKRAEILALIKGKKATARCFYFTTPLDVAHHMNLYRERVQSVRRIPDIAYGVYKKGFQEPTKKEGFESVTKIDFFPKFPTEEHKRLFLHRT